MTVAPPVQLEFEGSRPSLFDDAVPSFDGAFAAASRIRLDESAWIDVVPGWMAGSAALFAQVLTGQPWAHHERWIVDRHVPEPRLTARWSLGSGDALSPPLLESARAALSARYGVAFDSVGFNLYRDGRDGVAWHRDKIRRDIAEPIVALVSLGEPRRLMFRPRGGGRSRAFAIGRGDLLVTGGSTQRTWEHAILKVARAAPRISLAFRHGLDERAYDSRRPVAVSR